MTDALNTLAVRLMLLALLLLRCERVIYGPVVCGVLCGRDQFDAIVISTDSANMRAAL